MTARLQLRNPSRALGRLRKALKVIAGVESAQVDLAKGEAIVMGRADVPSLIRAIEDEGCEAALKG